jgi:hypothetical protein
MENKYKYISKPYKIEELVNGNPIFKFYSEYFNDIYEWEMENNSANEIESGIIDNRELIFNEFLNIVSLLIYDKINYIETFKLISIKSKELHCFNFIATIIPTVLEEIATNYDSEMSQKVEKFIIRQNDLNFTIEENDISANISKESNDNLSKIVTKFLNNVESVLTKDNIRDLHNFFDLVRKKMVTDLEDAFHSTGKRKESKISLVPTKSISLDTSIQVLIFEELMKIKNWEQISATKKGQLLSLIISKNDGNIKKVYLEIEKKTSQNTKKFLTDREKAFELLKEILG